MWENFDLSKVDTTNPYYEAECGANKPVVRKRKNEASGNAISEFVGLRLKMYSFEMVCSNAEGTTERVEKHRANGLQRSRIARFDHNQYVKQLRNPTENYPINGRF